MPFTFYTQATVLLSNYYTLTNGHTLWVDKTLKEQKRGVDVVMLLRCDPSTEWYKKLVEAGGRFAYFNERLKFSESKGSPNFASMLVFLEGKNE